MASLHHLLSIVQAELPAARGPLRLTCRALRDEHDACSQQLKLSSPPAKADQQPPNLKLILAGLVRRMPRLRSLHMDPPNSAFPFAYVLEQASRSACGATLREVSLLGSSALRSLAPMARFPLLEKLLLGECECVESIEPVSQLTHLKGLMIKGAWRLEDLSPLSACTALESVHLESLMLDNLVSPPAFPSLPSAHLGPCTCSARPLRSRHLAPNPLTTRHPEPSFSYVAPLLCEPRARSLTAPTCASST